MKKQRRFKVFGSFRARILAGTFGVFFILILSAAYIFFSARHLQTIQDRSFEQERFIASIRDDLAGFQEPLLDYLSTRSSNALARLLINSQNLRGKLPTYTPIIADPIALKERELYILIYTYLNLADQAVEEKRGRNIAAYTSIYDEMDDLMSYIDNEIETISTERFRNRMESYRVFIIESGSVQIWNLFFIVCISVFAMLLLFISVRRITGPLERLAVMAVELSGGNFDIEDIETNSVDEIDQVVEAFNRMKGEMRNYIEEIRWQENIKAEYMQEKMRNLKMEGLIRRVEIYALQAQMNPHFLFNTLNTGMQLAIVEGADRTSEYMEYMAQLFRHIIRNKEVFVPLRHEIDGLKFYFSILKVRFPKNLELILDYDEALLDTCKVPVSILQPLVENCVIHAFKDQTPDVSGSKSLINVRAEKQGTRLILSVRDNGCGMEKEKAEDLLHPLSIDESSISRVMGLENVIQRLYFFYPDDREVIGIESAKGEGSAVFIRIDTGRAPCTGF
ncbi:sensor histidine kinase [Leadbettera azotonutricia]|uniref:Putative histidine kinase internal region n=1 Tax=Leadbettera azotonutricia (strain ATCC BAA-888 / DSM 13862 / ZAS-9) TaxID=545695 RepID=F5YBD9_LEAAZ|nr:histidine kinase [Leadbettera azotonutricia]AEF80536.1 putative histidine kinase internal region [Leadbettera azotonutricia ZAS-9]